MWVSGAAERKGSLVKVTKKGKGTVEKRLSELEFQCGCWEGCDKEEEMSLGRWFKSDHGELDCWVKALLPFSGH